MGPIAATLLCYYEPEVSHRSDISTDGALNPERCSARTPY